MRVKVIHKVKTRKDEQGKKLERELLPGAMLLVGEQKGAKIELMNSGVGKVWVTMRDYRTKLAEVDCVA